MAATRPLTAWVLAAALAALVVAGLAAGCAGQDAIGVGGARPEAADGPPPLVLQTGQGTVELPAWSYCYQAGLDGGDELTAGQCADGSPPERPPLLSGGGVATFDFALEGWAFTADFRPAGARPGRCHPQWSARVTRHDLGGGGDRFELPAVAPAGTWDVDLFGRGGGNDLSTSFRWRTTETSSAPVTATATFLGPRDLGTPATAPHPTVRLVGLRPEPEQVTARLAVTASGGEQLAFVLEAGPDDCDLDGVVTLVTPTGPGEILVPGAPPFTYVLDLTLDGARHAGSGSWPEDLVAHGDELALSLK